MTTFSSSLQVEIKLKPGVSIPEYALPEDSGVDLRAWLNEPMTLQVHQRMLIPTGICMAIPSGYEAQIRSRSGLALQYGVVVLTGPGTIDAGYRGEIKVLLMNFGQEPFLIEPGMRIAQCVFAPIARTVFHQVESLSQTQREFGGFGSTGIL